ncbi:MAG: tannase [Clostridia bacterium]|nr:tannase [Clostridia bacterium]MDD6682868.1 tannase [Clostridiales bacterium]
MKKFLACMMAFALMLSCVSCFAEGESVPAKIDMTKWQYEAADDVYWQVGLSYAATPADSSYETMGIFVPGAYFTATDNGDGTYTCTVNESGTVGQYSAITAPLIIPVNTPGYSAMAAPTGYSSPMGYGSISDYTSEGIIVLFAGARGRDAGAPAGVTDFKAAIRYTRYNKDLLPGDMDSIFSLGMSGGAQSALIGASGNSDLYTPYLAAIGAVMTESDAVKGSMCWCPITNLDIADEAYEWNMGNTRSGLSKEEQAYSDGMALAFAEYINGLGLTDDNGTALVLAESEEGICQSGTYYDYVKDVIETSLEHFLSDTEFPYAATSSGGFGGRDGRGGMRGGNFGGTEGGFADPGNGEIPDFGNGEKPDFANGEIPDFGGENAEQETAYEEMDGITRAESTSSALSLSGTYETKQDYIAALNANGEWVTWDEETNTVTITSVAAFTQALKNASKGIAAFDQLDRGQGENTLFGYGDGNGAHFDAILAELVQGSEYEAAFAEDLAKQDALGNTVDVRLNMYNPMYYLSPAYEGYQTSEPATYWRIRTGINQGDTALCTEIDLALAAEPYAEGTQVDFETVWGQGHTEAERTGSSTANFIAWVQECMK